MSSRNGSYATRVDRMAVGRATTPIERAKSAPTKAAPSPQSARPAFKNAKVKSIAEKARKAKGQFMPSPARAPQPRGMGEAAVNQEAYSRRANALREQVEGPKADTAMLPPKIADKAKKAARGYRTVSPDMDKGQSPDR